MTEKSVAHAKDTYTKAKVASEEAVDLFESTFACAAKGLTGFDLKLIEITRANTRAAFDFAHELMGVKSPSEFIELSTAQMREQFQIASAQNKDLCALAQQVATETAEPNQDRHVQSVQKGCLIARKFLTYRTPDGSLSIQQFDFSNPLSLFDGTT